MDRLHIHYIPPGFIGRNHGSSLFLTEGPIGTHLAWAEGKARVVLLLVLDAVYSLCRNRMNIRLCIVLLQLHAEVQGSK